MMLECGGKKRNIVGNLQRIESVSPGPVSRSTRIFGWVLGTWFLAWGVVGCQTTPSRAPAAPGSPAVAIVVSSNAPIFVRTANRLVERLRGRAKIYTLSADRGRNTSILKAVQGFDRRQVVAIGLRAALAAKRLAGKHVVFSQVFNYEARGLVTPTMKGVSAAPPPVLLFRAWKDLDPALTKVGVITGPQLSDVVAKAKEAATISSIKLIHVVVHSDKEMSYAYKKLAQKVQGFWLLPDNRVLSRRVIREILSYSVKQGKQVMVFTPQLLKIGGLISAESTPSDIAARVALRLKQAAGKVKIPGPGVMPLTDAHIRINAIVARRFGLEIPSHLKGMIYAP